MEDLHQASAWVLVVGNGRTTPVWVGTALIGVATAPQFPVMLSYLDTRGVTRGGVFAANGDDFTGLYGTQASIDFEDNGNVMIWRVPSAEPLRAERIMKPETRPATFGPTRTTTMVTC